MIDQMVTLNVSYFFEKVSGVELRYEQVDILKGTVREVLSISCLLFWLFNHLSIGDWNYGELQVNLLYCLVHMETCPIFLISKNMKRLFGEEIRLDWKIAVLVVSSTLLIVIDSYHAQLVPWEKWLLGWKGIGLSTKIIDRTLLFFVIPLLVVLLVFKQKAGEFGFTFGDWKAGILLTISGILFIAPVLWLVCHGDTTMQSYYKGLVPGLPFSTLLDLFGWEFMFRGWLLFGFARKFGSEAIWLQAVPFALAHIGKPEIETLSTIFGGFAFGWLAWRTKSFIYPLLIHWFVSSFTIIVAAGLLG